MSENLQCTDCNSYFDSAASLLQHFAEHASKNRMLNDTKRKKGQKGKRKMPNLYPIDVNMSMKINNDNECDSGIEDNPLKYCIVTMDEDKEDNLRTMKEQMKINSARKYQCFHCCKKFGWSTDLKRHMLIHTGERPFQCKYCDSTFTRNFLLQKHIKKIHGNGRGFKMKLPDLTPITSFIFKKNEEKFNTILK